MSAAENFPDDAKIATAKKATRQTIKRRLAELAFNRADVASRLFLNLERLPEFRAAETLGVYLDFGSEAPIRPFFARRLNARSVRDLGAAPRTVAARFSRGVRRRPSSRPRL